jgi:fructokinase
MTAYIGVDLGGTKTEVAVLDANGQFLFRHRRPTPSHDYQAILHTIADLVKTALAHTGLAPTEAVGCGIPGCLDPDTHRVRGANTVVLNGQLFQSDLQQLLQCQVPVQNDANCLAVSEATDGAGQGSQVLFAAILGTGCGGGIALEGQAWKGRHAIAGEWGHNPLPWPTPEELQAPPCWCGQVGCMETWISASGFASDHARRYGGNLSALEIIQAMREGDTHAQASWVLYIQRLGRGLAQVINFLDPDCIVLGGGMSNVDEIYLPIQAEILRHAFSKTVQTPVRKAQHGDSSGVRGAAWLARAVTQTSADP